MQETKKEYHKQEINTRKERWQGKTLHGQYLKDIEGKVDCDMTWNWLTNGELKKETEGFIMAAHDQARALMPSKPKSTRLPMTANADCARRRRKPSTI